MSSGPDEPGQDWAAPGAPPPPTWSPDQPAPIPGGGWPDRPDAPASYQQPGWSGGYAATPAAPRPGIVPLRPLGVGEILDGAFTAIRRYPRATLGLAAAVMFVVALIDLLSQYWLLAGITPPANESLSKAGDYLARLGTVTSISGLVTLLATLLLSGLVTAVVGQAVLGRPASAAQAWARLRPLLWRLIGVSLLTFLILGLAAAVPLVPGLVLLGVGSSAAVAGAVLVLGAIAGGALAVWSYVALVLAPAALVLEQQTVLGALRRSRALVRRSWWRVFGIVLLSIVIATVLSGIIGVPFSFAGGSLTSLGGRTSAVQFSQLAFNAVGTLLAGTIVRPFSAGVIALLYIDRRMRAEALDVTLIREASGAAPE